MRSQIQFENTDQLSNQIRKDRNNALRIFKKEKNFSNLRTEVFGKSFENPLGLAAGFDKNADAIPGLFDLGFGFLELGTVTPMPQLGNEKPRVFKIPEYEAVIQRLGFNNRGVEDFLRNLKNFDKKRFI